MPKRKPDWPSLAYPALMFLVGVVMVVWVVFYA
jgi:hypothetical protein